MHSPINESDSPRLGLSLFDYADFEYDLPPIRFHSLHTFLAFEGRSVMSSP